MLWTADPFSRLFTVSSSLSHTEKMDTFCGKSSKAIAGLHPHALHSIRLVEHDYFKREAPSANCVPRFVSLVGVSGASISVPILPSIQGDITPINMGRFVHHSHGTVAAPGKVQYRDLRTHRPITTFTTSDKPNLDARLRVFS